MLLNYLPTLRIEKRNSCEHLGCSHAGTKQVRACPFRKILNYRGIRDDFFFILDEIFRKFEGPFIVV